MARYVRVWITCFVVLTPVNIVLCWALHRLGIHSGWLLLLLPLPVVLPLWVRLESKLEEKADV